MRVVVTLERRQSCKVNPRMVRLSGWVLTNEPRYSHSSLHCFGHYLHPIREVAKKSTMKRIHQNRR